MKHFVPTPSEGRESEGEPFTFFNGSWGGGGETSLQATRTKVSMQPLWKQFLSMHYKLPETHKKTTETRELILQYIH